MALLSTEGKLTRTRKRVKFRRGAFALALMAGALFSSRSKAQSPGVSACGVERWRIKVALDEDVGSIDTIPVASTVSALGELPRPIGPLPPRNRQGPYELETFTIRAILLRAIPEDDGDWHLILRDPAAPQRTIIAELPDSACALGSPYAHAFAEARRQLSGAFPGALLEIRGVGFFDYFHRQRGIAPNGFELHPVLRITVLPKSIARQ